MNQTNILNNSSNYPGQHIKEDLQNLELDYQQPRQNQDNKYSIFFLIFQSIVVFISLLSVAIGNSKQLGFPFDSNGNICGQSLGLEQYKYIYFSNPINDKSLYLTVCVKECPIQENENEVDELFELYCMPNQLIKTCKNNQIIGDNDFSLIYYDSLKFINVCLPTKLSYLKNVLVGLESHRIFRFFQDLNNGFLLILCTFLFTTLINQIVYILLIKLQQKTIWIIQVTLILVLILLTFIFINYYLFQFKLQQLNSNSTKLTLQEVISIVQINNSIFSPLILSVFFAILAIYYTLDLIYNYKKYQIIGLKIAIVNYFYDYKSKVLQDNHINKQPIFTHFYLIPIAFGVIIAVIFFIWVLIANYILTIGNVTTYRYPFNTFHLNLLAYIFGIIHILDLFLILLVISGINKFLIIGIILEQYSFFIKQGLNNYQFKKDKSIKKILQFFLFNKLGILILGEILIAFVQIPKIIIKMYLWMIMMKNPNYQVSNLISNILSINERAYILSFIRPDGFLLNAKCQYQFDKKLMQHSQIQQTYGQLFTNSCCLTISGLCLSFTYLLLIMTKTTIIIQDPINFLLFSFISSYFITKFYSQIYGNTIDNLTILLYRDVTVDGKVVGKSVKKPIRLLKETVINFDE